MRRLASVAAVLLFAAGCTDPSPVPGELAAGTWGGDNAGVIVTATSTHVHVGCTFGNIPVRVEAGPDGRFGVAGTYVLRAFPVAVGPELPAVFSGRVIGRTLTLTVAVDDTTEGKLVNLGPVSVQLGRDPNLGPCPICRVPSGGSSMPAGR